MHKIVYESLRIKLQIYLHKDNTMTEYNKHIIMHTASLHKAQMNISWQTQLNIKTHILC